MSTETKPAKQRLRHFFALAAALAFAVGSHAAQGQHEPDGAATDGTVHDAGAQTRIGIPPDELAGEQPDVPDVPRLDDPDDGELPEGGDRAFLAAVVSAGGARDEGFRVGDQELEDTSYVVTPTLLFLNRPSERAELAIGYAPEIESFQDHPELDAVHHAAGLLWRFDPSDRSRISFGASLLDGEDPSRHLDGLIVLLPRTPYTQARAHVDLARRWRFTGLSLHVGRTDTEIEGTEGLLGSGVDQTDDYAMLTLEQMAGRRTDLFASYSYLDPTPGPDAPADEQGLLPGVLTEPIQTLQLGFTRRLTRLVTLEIAGGLLDDGREPAEDEDRYTYIASGEIRREGDELTFRVRYDRSLLSLTQTIPAAGGGAAGPAPPSAALHDSLAHTATLDFEIRPGPYLRWQQLVRATLAELDDVDGAGGATLAAEDIETIALTSRLILPATRRFAVYAQVDHFETQGGFFAPDEGVGAADRSRTRYGAGLIVGISGPPAAWGIREEPALLLRTLRPDRY